MIEVLYYDRCEQGFKRLRQNANLIAGTAAGIDLNLKLVNRASKFFGEDCAEDILLGNEFPYAGVILNSLAKDFNKVYDAALLRAECEDMGCDKIIVLGSSNVGSYAKGVLHMPARGGNGYLLPEDAKNLVDRIKRWEKI